MRITKNDRGGFTIDGEGDFCIGKRTSAAIELGENVRFFDLNDWRFQNANTLLLKIKATKAALKYIWSK